MKKRIFVALIIISLSLFLVGCIGQNSEQINASEKDSKDFVEIVDSGDSSFSVKIDLESFYFNDFLKDGAGDYLVLATEQIEREGKYPHIIALFKYNRDGKLLWKNRLSDCKTCFGESIKQINNDEYLLFASFKPEYYADNRPWLLRFSKSGDLLWEKNKTVGWNLHFASFKIIPDGESFVLGGRSSYLPAELIVFSIDKEGNKIFEFKPKNDITDLGLGGFRDMIKLKDGSYLIISADEFYTHLTKIDNAGIELWTKSFGCMTDENEADAVVRESSKASDDWIVSAIEDEKGNILLYIRSFHKKKCSLHILKFDSFGNELWRKTYYTNDSQIVAYSFIETKDHNYLASGFRVSNDLRSSAFVLKINGDGNELWQKVYNVSKVEQFEISDEDFLENYVLYGSIRTRENTNILVLVLDIDGNEVWRAEKERKNLRQDQDYIIDFLSKNLGNEIFIVSSTIGDFGLRENPLIEKYKITS